MMTLQDIEAATINEDVAREAYTQAEKRLEDTLATKASYEQKAFTLLAAYITVAIALFTVSGLFRFLNDARGLTPAFLIVGIIYTVGAAVSLVALWDQMYGTLGSAPCMWLRHGVIDGDGKALPANLAYVTFFHQARIDAGVAANRSKAKLVRGVIIIGMVATFILGVWLFLAVAEVF
jgi:F0F1-type ATP synthase assembly protein I